jgi:thiol-disulfide isomerase/thioredoxin
MDSADRKPHPGQVRGSRRAVRLIALGALAVAVVVPALQWRLALNDDASPDFGLGQAAAEGRLTPERLRLQWNSGSIARRRAAFATLAGRRASRPDLLPLWRDWLPEAAFDPDDQLRLRALGEVSKAGQADDLARLGWQLADPDPEIRRAAVLDLQRAGGAAQAPWLAPVVDDPDPSIAFAADAALRTLTGRDSGLRIAMILDPEPTARRAADARRREAAKDWRAWLAGNPPIGSTPSPPPAPARLSRRPAPDFKLRDLEGHRVALSDFAGKLVLINFWTTWCTACVQELPDLVELQRTHPDLVILGVSLDAPDGATGAAGSDHDHDDDQHAPEGRSAVDVRHALQNAVTKFHLNYRVLCDPDMSAGAAYCGGELPTQVIVDRKGRLVRRFLGPRSPAAWDALLKEADLPSP